MAAQKVSKAYKCTILVIGFVAYFIADSSYKINGLFYAAHLEAFPTQTSLLAIVYGMTYSVGPLFSPLMALLVRYQGEKRVAVGCSLFMFAGYGLSYFASDARLLLLTFGLMVPVAAEGLYFFPMTLLAHNFDRRLTLASGVVASGCGTGLLLSAPATQLLIGSLTWRGAVVVLGAAALNAGALALLIRPRSPESRELPQKESPETNGDCAKSTPQILKDVNKQSGCNETCQLLRVRGADTGFLFLSAMILIFAAVTVINFVPVMASELSVPDSRIALFPAGYGAAFTLGNLVFGYLGTRLEPFLVDSASLAVSAALACVLPASVRLSEALGLAVYCGMGACQGGRNALMVSELKIAFGLGHYEICAGLYFASCFFGAFPAPTVGQRLRRQFGNYLPVFYLAAAAFAVAACAKLASWALQPGRRWRRQGWREDLSCPGHEEAAAAGGQEKLLTTAANENSCS